MKLFIKYDTGYREINDFDSIEDIKAWVEGFYQITYEEVKAYTKAPSYYIKYGIEFKFELEDWFNQMGVKIED